MADHAPHEHANTLACPTIDLIIIFGAQTQLDYKTVNPNFFHHISFSSVTIRFHTKNQLPRLSRSALKVGLGWVPLNYVPYQLFIG